MNVINAIKKFFSNKKINEGNKTHKKYTENKLSNNYYKDIFKQNYRKKKTKNKSGKNNELTESYYSPKKQHNFLNILKGAVLIIEDFWKKYLSHKFKSYEAIKLSGKKYKSAFFQKDNYMKRRINNNNYKNDTKNLYEENTINNFDICSFENNENNNPNIYTTTNNNDKLKDEKTNENSTIFPLKNIDQ